MKKMLAYDLMVYCHHGADVALSPLIRADADIVVPEDVWVWSFSRAEGKMWTNAASWLSGKSLDEMDEANPRGKERIRQRGGVELVMPDGSLFPTHTGDSGKLVEATKKVHDEDLKLIRRYNFRCPRCRFDPPLNTERVDARLDGLIEEGFIGVSLRMLEGMTQRR